MKAKRVMGYIVVSVFYALVFWAVPIFSRGIREGIMIGLIVHAIFAVFVSFACFIVWAFDMTDWSN